MAEEEFERSEVLRRQLEQRKAEVQQGKDRIIEFIRENWGDNPVMREYLSLVADRVNKSLKQVQSEVLEQDLALDALKKTMDQFSSRLTELQDSLNLFANQSLRKQEEHNARVKRTCDVIDREINL